MLAFESGQLTAQQVLEERAGLAPVVLDWLLRMDSLRRINADETDRGLLAVERQDDRVAVDYPEDRMGVVSLGPWCLCEER